MPRKHPKEEERSSGPSPAVLAERRALRAEKRMRKSPPDSQRKSLLTNKEAELLADAKRQVLSSEPDSPERRSKLRAIQSELDANKESFKRKKIDF